MGRRRKRRREIGLEPAVSDDRVELGLVDPHLVAHVGAILRNQRAEEFPRRETRLIEVSEGSERGQGLGAIVGVGAAGVRAVIAGPFRRRQHTAVWPALKDFVTRLEGLPHAGAGVAQRLRAVGLAAMCRVRQRRPRQSDKSAPGEIVESGVGVLFGRRDVVDEVGRDFGLHVLSECGPRRKERGGEADGDKRPTADASASRRAVARHRASPLFFARPVEAFQRLSFGAASTSATLTSRVISERRVREFPQRGTSSSED